MSIPNLVALIFHFFMAYQFYTCRAQKFKQGSSWNSQTTIPYWKKVIRRPLSERVQLNQTQIESYSLLSFTLLTLKMIRVPPSYSVPILSPSADRLGAGKESWVCEDRPGGNETLGCCDQMSWKLRRRLNAEVKQGHLQDINPLEYYLYLFSPVKPEWLSNEINVTRVGVYARDIEVRKVTILVTLKGTFGNEEGRDEMRASSNLFEVCGRFGSSREELNTLS